MMFLSTDTACLESLDQCRLYRILRGDINSESVDCRCDKKVLDGFFHTLTVFCMNIVKCGSILRPLYNYAAFVLSKQFATCMPKFHFVSLV